MDPKLLHAGQTPGPGGSAAALTAALRTRIASGELTAGQRLREEQVAQAHGVSRMPVRLAFRTLAEEGLLQRAGARGYEVRAFSATDVECAVEVRGVLEGLAARRLAERGLTAAESDALQDCLDEGEAVLAAGVLLPEDVQRWSQLNQRFHATVVDGAGSSVVATAIARNDHLPFASAGSILVDPGALSAEYRKLQLAQLQHRLLVQALRAGEAARAEALAREHALIGLRYADLFSPGAADQQRPHAWSERPRPAPGPGSG
jgi:GntR family transcriptional regulator, vanillate catabolism transcriptional regulator